VFTSFTLSQTGMVVHHLKEREKGWKLSVVNSTVGAIATFLVALVVIVSKFLIGAWIIVVLIPIIVMAFRGVAKHYRGVGKQLSVEPGPEAPPLHHGVVVLVGSVNRSALMALRYARAVGADDLVAVSVAIDEDHAERLRQQWAAFGLTVPVEIIESPYRDLTGTVLEYLDQLDGRWGHDYLTVILPEAIVAHWWLRVFHNQSALALKVKLLARRDTVVVTVPYHLDGSDQLVVGRKKSGATLTETTSAGEPYATNQPPPAV